MNVLLKMWIMVIWTMSVSADWTLGTIFNQSDLVLEQAWRYGTSGKPRTLSSLTKVFKDSRMRNRTSVVVKYHISSQGIVLRAVDSKHHVVDIFLDGQPTHSIEWNRKKTRNITNFPQKCLVADGAFCARVLMQDVADGKYVADPLAQAHSVPTIFNMTISGSKGSYEAVLQEA